MTSALARHTENMASSMGSRGRLAISFSCAFWPMKKFCQRVERLSDGYFLLQKLNRCEFLNVRILA